MYGERMFLKYGHSQSGITRALPRECSQDTSAPEKQGGMEFALLHVSFTLGYSSIGKQWLSNLKIAGAHDDRYFFSFPFRLIRTLTQSPWASSSSQLHTGNSAQKAYGHLATGVCSCYCHSLRTRQWMVVASSVSVQSQQHLGCPRRFFGIPHPAQCLIMHTDSRTNVSLWVNMLKCRCLGGPFLMASIWSHFPEDYLVTRHPWWLKSQTTFYETLTKEEKKNVKLKKKNTTRFSRV